MWRLLCDDAHTRTHTHDNYEIGRNLDDNYYDFFKHRSLKILDYIITMITISK